MGETLTDRVKAIKNDDLEFVNIAEINAAFDKFDNHFIPSAKLISTVTQTIPNNTVTKLTYSAIGHDSYSARAEGPMASLATDDITVRKAGLYIVSAGYTWVSNATGVRRIDIVKNGVSTAGDIKLGYVGGGNSITVTTPLVLAVNDVISISVFQNSGAPLDVNNNAFPEGNWLGVVWAGSIT